MRRAANLVKDLVSGHDRNPIAILGAIQERYRYLPEDAIRQLALSLAVPLRDVYGLATFYKSFRLKPMGNHLISVCVGTACHVRGAPSIAEEFMRQLGVSPGETTPDDEFSLETVM